MSRDRKPDGTPPLRNVEHGEPAAFDNLREHCPVARSETTGWSLYRHHDVSRVLADPETFSNAVSSHLSVPNGTDPPEHTDYRRVIEPCFSRARMAAFEPQCRDIAARLTASVTGGTTVEFMDGFAGAFAAEAQCAFLGWPGHLPEILRAWVHRNQDATRTGDRERLGALAGEFTAEVEALLTARRRPGERPRTDITASLLQEEIRGRPLRTDEIVSILRNWTAGEVGTIAASVGILVHYLGQQPQLQDRLRAEPDLLPPAIDEILRLDGPLVANRRRATCPVEIGGRRIEQGARLFLVWIAANRDPAVFEQPGEFRWDRDPADNLLYGAGIHVCPGAPLARLELRVVLEEILRSTTRIEPAPDGDPVRASWPAAGFERLPLRLHGR